MHLTLAFPCLKPMTTDCSVNNTHQACSEPSYVLGAGGTGTTDTSGVFGRRMPSRRRHSGGSRGAGHTRGWESKEGFLEVTLALKKFYRISKSASPRAY